MSTRRVTKAKHWQPFFNTSVLASYHFELQMVILDSIDSTILRAVEAKAPAARYKVYPLLTHEFTHWIDHVSSLWGRRLLYSYFKGLNARATDSLSEFPWMLEAKKAVHRSTSNRYFFSMGPKAGSPPPWAWALSIGCRFDRGGRQDESDPIPFVVFGVGDIESPNRIARMPISPAALCEVRALNSELAWVTREEERMGTGNTPASRQKWLQEFSSMIYNDEFLVYTAALHLLANHTGSVIAADVLPAASALAWVALNFPPSLTKSLQIPSSWSTGWISREKGIDRISPLLTTCDPGFIYILLCQHADSPQGKDVDLWLNTLLLKALGIPGSEFRAALQEERLRCTNNQLSDLNDPQFQGWMGAGAQWADALGIAGGCGPLLDELNVRGTLPMPEVMTEEFRSWSIGGPLVDLGISQTLEERCDYMEKMRDSIDEFLDVCGL